MEDIQLHKGIYIKVEILHHVLMENAPSRSIRR